MLRLGCQRTRERSRFDGAKLGRGTQKRILVHRLPTSHTGRELRPDVKQVSRPSAGAFGVRIDR
jgi:hypothetical protein